MYKITACRSFWKEGPTSFLLNNVPPAIAAGPRRRQTRSVSQCHLLPQLVWRARRTW
jgi:hypothetical protein